MYKLILSLLISATFISSCAKKNQDAKMEADTAVEAPAESGEKELSSEAAEIPSGDELVERMSSRFEQEGVKLNEDQMGQLNSMMAGFDQNSFGSEAEARKAFKELRRKAMATILTPEQREQIRNKRDGGK